MAFGGSSGGASILDLHSGALSKGKEFINVYKYPGAQKVFESATAIKAYRVILVLTICPRCEYSKHNSVTGRKNKNKPCNQ